MENQANFDLNGALWAWKQDCASRPGVSSDDARELECHLRDCVAEFQAQGMKAEAAFHAALRRVGLPGEIAREFARENPLAVWLDRVFWATTAALAFSLWATVSGSLLLWLFNDFRPLLLFPNLAAWHSILCYLPVLAAGALVATGRLGRAREWLQWCMQSRLRFALLGATCTVAVALVNLCEMPQASLLRNVLLFLDLLLWPTILLAAGTALLRPLSSVRWAGSGADPRLATPAVWRERVFWMAASGLSLSVWWSLTALGVVALFYTGDMSHPFDLHPLVWAATQIGLQLAPAFMAAWLIFRHLRGALRLPPDVAPARRSIAAIAVVMFCALLASRLATTYLWLPHEASWQWSTVLMHHALNLEWLWPASLATLTVWLAPNCQEDDEAQRAVSF